MESNPELEAAIRAAPDDDDPYLVYGDWLQQRGEPMGRLVAIQHARAASPDDPELRAAEEALFAEHTEQFFGPPHPHADTPVPVRASELQWSRWKKTKRAWAFGHATTHWRNGFVHKLQFDTGYYVDDGIEGPAAAAILSNILALPALRFVREIEIGEIWMDDEGPQLGHALAAIAQSPATGSLRAIRCLGGEHDISGVSCDATDLWGACPQLEELVLYGNLLDVGEIREPGLRRLAIHSGGIDGSVVEAITAAEWPALEDLELWIGREYYGASVTMQHLAPILDGARLPALRRLGLMNCEFGDAICQALPTAPILPRLSRLDLTMGIVTDLGARALLAAAPALAHLDELAIAGYFSPEVADALRAMGANVTLRGTDTDTYRYVEIGE